MIWYNGNINYKDNLDAEAEASAIFGLLKYRYIYGSEEQSGLFLFGRKIKTQEDCVDSFKDKEDSDTDTGSAENTSDKLSKLFSFISDDENRDAIDDVKNIVFKLLRHVFPREIEGEIHFGLDDPYLTGKVLEFFALLYAMNGDRLKVYPYWDEKKLECGLKLSGRVLVMYSLFIVCRLILNKNFKKLWRKYNGK
ncbi:MAG: hypothetical protein Q4E54_01035 [Lachnospiraceae bacterium]|nr:hypothetical protein [Lachnospiraceae bacterium]